MRADALVASMGVQAALVAAAVLSSLAYMEVLPRFAPEAPLALPVLTAAPPVPQLPDAHRLSSPGAVALALPSPRHLAAPSAPAPAAWAPAGVSTGAPDLGLAPAVVGPPPPVARVAPQPQPGPHPGPMAIGGEVEQARCLACRGPAYPMIARQAHIEGDVVLRALIGRDGRVERLELRRGNRLLAGAAEQAVRAWRYQPLLLDGRAVEVVSDITVRFRLGAY